MSPEAIGFLAIGILLLLIVLRCPVALAMILTGAGGFAAIVGWQPAVSLFMTGPFEVASNYSFTMIPLFLLMGNLAAQTGLSRDLFAAARRLMGGWRGSLALASVTASAGFAAVSGSSLATAATMGRVALPEMKRQGYSDRLASGSLAAGGTLGIMIPPSIALLLYALITEQSVGALFLAGVLPGLLAFALYLLVIAIWLKLHPEDAGRPETATEEPLWPLLWRASPVALLFATVMGGLYGGVFTPTEAAGAGAMLTLLVALARGLKTHAFAQALRDTVATSAALFLIIIGAEIFGFLLSVSQLSFGMVDLIREWGLAPWQVLVVILVFYVIFGCFMDSLAMILLTVPIFYPLIVESGFDPVWFGIVAVVTVELGLITPPVGMNLFVTRSVAPDIAMQDIMRGILPFVGIDLLRLAILAAFPALSLWLPKLLGAY